MKDTKMVEAMEFDKYFRATTWQEGNRLFFNHLAAKYDRLNEVISLGQQGAYKRSAVRDLDLRPGDRVLDACTGTGDMAFLIARRSPDILVEAVDVAEEMLNLAEKKKEYTGLRNILFQTADALHLPFADDRFDRVMMSFGLRNFVDMRAGLVEIRRVLKPGGKFVMLDLGKPRGWRKALYHVYYERLMPWLGKVWFHRHEYNSYAYLSRSNRYFPSPEIIMHMMRQAGFQDVELKEYMFGGVAQLMGVR